MKISTSADRLKELMVVLGVSQAEISEKTKIDKSTLSLYINGKREPRQDKLAIISEAYNVDAGWLMGLDVPMQKPKTIGELSPILAEFSEDLKFKEALSNYVNMLNEKGKDRLLETLEEMSQLEKYTKE